MMWKNQRWFCLDTETTGLQPGVDRIVAIGGVWFQNGSVLKESHALIDPQRPISPSASAVNGVTNAMVVGCPTIEQVGPGLFQELRHASVLLVYNWGFDDDFLFEAFGQLWVNACANLLVVDVLVAARAVLPGLPSHRLTHVVAALGLPGAAAAHTATADARMTCEVLHALAPKIRAHPEAVGRWGRDLEPVRVERANRRATRRREVKPAATTASEKRKLLDEQQLIVHGHRAKSKAAISHHQAILQPFDWSAAWASPGADAYSTWLKQLAGAIEGGSHEATVTAMFHVFPRFAAGLPVRTAGAVAADRGEITLCLEDVHKAVPTQVPRALQSGKISWRDRPKTELNLLYQDYVCSWVLRAAGAAFAFLPSFTDVLVHAEASALNSATGHDEYRLLVSALVTRERFESLDLSRVDPSDCIDAMDANMNFSSRAGLQPVEKLPADALRLLPPRNSQ